MGGWDSNCSLCGGPLRVPYEPFQNEDSGDAGLDPTLITPEELGWLDGALVLGFNPEAGGVDKCFITGPGVADDYGWMDCEKGGDENVPPGSDDPERVQVPIYSTSDLELPSAFPFHRPCLQIFERVVFYQIHGNALQNLGISKDVLYSVMVSRFKEYEHCLELDYGELNTLVREQYWYSPEGTTIWVADPVSSSKIEPFYQSLRDTGPFVYIPPPITYVPPPASPGSLNSDESDTEEIKRPKEDKPRGPNPSPPNPFTKLAKELNLEILLHLPYTSIQSFTLSGLSQIEIQQAQGFWKQKLFIDFPFLWDFPQLEGERNWLDIYREVRKSCIGITDILPDINFSPPTRQVGFHMGLANRRRVWNTCMQLAGCYLKELEARKEVSGDRNIEEAIVKQSKSFSMPIVAFPLSNELRTSSLFFISKMADVGEGLELRFHFEHGSQGHFLCGIEIEGRNLVGRKGSKFGSLHVVDIGKDDWIKGFVLNIKGASDLGPKAQLGISGLKMLLTSGKEIEVGSQNGDKRLMMVSKGMLITGIISEYGWAQNNIIQRIGLLQHPHPSSPTSNSSPPKPSRIENHLWKSSLPPPSLIPSPYTTGYWSPARSLDTIHTEASPFFTTPQEAAFLTGISSDPQLRAFSAHFKDGSSKTIGPNDAKKEDVKRFDIDGEGGERIVKVEVGMNALPIGIKITTNLNRKAFFGQTQKNWHVTYEPGDGGLIAGLYASFGYREDDRLCTTLSIFSIPTQPSEEPFSVDGVKDHTAFSAPSEEDGLVLVGPREQIAFVDQEDFEKYSDRVW